MFSGAYIVVDGKFPYPHGEETSQFLQDTEVIVGLYGVKGQNDHITSLGFIVVDSTNFL